MAYSHRWPMQFAWGKVATALQLLLHYSTPLDDLQNLPDEQNFIKDIPCKYMGFLNRLATRDSTTHQTNFTFTTILHLKNIQENAVICVRNK